MSAENRGGNQRGPAIWDLVRRFVEASPDCIWILGLHGEVDYINPRARALLGAAPADAPCDLRDLWPEENRFTLGRALAAAAAGQSYRFRTFLHDEAQSRGYWETVVEPMRDDRGAVAGLIAIARDVTHEVETASFLTTVVQLLPSPLLVKNVSDRRFVLVNRAAEELLGAPADDALGRTAEELGAAGAERFHAWEDEVLAAGEMRAFEHELVGPDGRVRSFAVKLLATHDDLGPRHLIALSEDVTEQRATARTLRAALQAAEQASEAKSAFLANMTHELRTPLNGVIAGADMLARDRLSPRAQDLVSMIRDSGSTLERLVSDILDLARIDAGQVAVDTAPFHVGEAVRSAAALFCPEAEQKGVTLETEVSPALDGLAEGDEARLRQVLHNLLSNAVKFTAHGRIRACAERIGDRAHFTVEDTGEGFAPEAKARIFGRFQQADETFTRRFGGAGLGLAIARELVELMGGSLDAEGVLGTGSRFWFEIPLPDRAGAAPANDEAEPARAIGLRVLAADDHPTNRQVVRLMMGEIADVVCVENGAEAVEAFAASRFDLVLMDMQMPVMDGLDAIRGIRRLEADRGLPRTPVIMLTANTRPEHLAASLEAGADRHLGKPLTTAALFSALEDALAGAPETAEDATALYANFGHPRA